jgi:hypothetical protein
MILDGYGSLFDHLPVQLIIRWGLRNEDGDRQFRFNTSFLEEPQLLVQLQKIWTVEPRSLLDSPR